MGHSHGLESFDPAPREPLGPPGSQSPPAPPLPGDVVVRPTLEDLLDEAADDVFTHASNCVRAFGDFHLALSGGRGVRRLAMRLMIDPQFRELPWKYTHLWVTSDADVAEDDDRSTIGAVRGLIGDHAGVPARQVHAMSPGRSDGLERYERELKETLAWREKGHDRLDCVVLGVGDEGELDGISPAGVADRGLLVSDATDGETVHSMTTGLVRASRLICVLGVGEHGARAWAAAERARSIDPLNGVLRWYLDHAACARGDDGRSNGGAV